MKLKENHYETMEEALESGSIIPQQCSKNGLDDESLEEIIICESISGGANYENDMPKELTLLRKLADGTEYTMNYIQDPNMLNQSSDEILNINEVIKNLNEMKYSPENLYKNMDQLRRACFNLDTVLKDISDRVESLVKHIEVNEK